MTPPEGPNLLTCLALFALILVAVALLVLGVRQWHREKRQGATPCAPTRPAPQPLAAEDAPLTPAAMAFLRSRAHAVDLPSEPMPGERETGDGDGDRVYILSD